MSLESGAQGCGRPVGIGVRSTRRLGDDLVDHPEIVEVPGRELERLGGAFLLARVVP